MTIDHFSSAGEMLAALRAREISSVELTDMHIERIEARDGPINAIPVRTFERARDSAAAADARIAAGESAPLLGLPVTLKESTQVAGLPQSAGMNEFKDYRPATDCKLATSIFGAGTNLLGKTNIPVALGDWQADSPVYGRTHNPWDLTRTPGGSTGGGSAALAAGFTPLEQGSDIGGSIRVPAAYCGLYGHRPSETAIPGSGAFPMADLPNNVFYMGVQGPLARTATDMELFFDVMAGPDVFADVGWKLDLPPARHTSLADFRVAVMAPIPGVRASSAVLGRQEELIALLRDAGATVETAMPPFDVEDYFDDYMRALQVMTTQGMPAELRAQATAGYRAMGTRLGEAMAEGLNLSAIDYLSLGNRRQAYALQWQHFFRDFDVLIGPITLDVAFPHKEGNFTERTLLIDNEEVGYYNNIVYPMLPIFCGLPATAFPAGRDAQGLPIGLQAVGAHLEDRTTMAFARLLEERWHRFEAPPGY